MADVPSPPARDVVDRAWPAPWGPAQPGAVRLATQERVPLEAITGSVQGEVQRAQVDAKRVQIERALQGQGQLPPVTFVQDPRAPGGLVALDGNHTLQAYRELGACASRTRRFIPTACSPRTRSASWISSRGTLASSGREGDERR